MRRFLLWMGIVALVLQAGAGMAQAAERPFKVTASVSVRPTTNEFFPGTAVGTEIGQGLFEVSPTGGSGNLLTDPWGPFVWCGTLLGNMLFTTSTGETITAELLGLGCQTALQGPPGSPFTPFSGQATGLYRITGGTGRFTNATGSGFVTGTIEAPTDLATVTLSFEGTINY